MRLIAARVLTILAVLVAFVGMLSFAVERTVLDESGVERIATDLIQDEPSASRWRSSPSSSCTPTSTSSR